MDGYFDETRRFFTDPYNPDSDFDGVPDKAEIISYTFLSDGSFDSEDIKKPDSDNDGLRAELDSDSDNGGLPDGMEDLNHNGLVDIGERDPFDPEDDKITFRLLAVESSAGTVKMKDGQYVISALLDYENWNNGTDFTSYIHLLSLYNETEIFEECRPFYVGETTKSNLIEQINTFLASADSNEIVLLYLSCDGDTEGLYLGAPFKHISPNELIQWLNTGNLTETTLCIILETCHSGFWINDGEGGILGEGRFVMTACASDQLAYAWGGPGWSVFTGNEEDYYKNGTIGPVGFIGSLTAANDKDNNSWVSMSESFEFAGPSTEQYMAGRGKQQNPKMYNGLTFDPPFILRELFLSTDLNKDGTVGIQDLFIISKAFGSHGADIPNPGDSASPPIIQLIQC